jgi:ribosomal protein S18 acetylase RimI-like enzyme
MMIDPMVIEHRALAAWPGTGEAWIEDAWLMREADGFSRRANSVTVLKATRAPIADSWAEVRAWYRARGLPAIARVTPAATATGLDALLASAGARVEEPSRVMVATGPFASPPAMEGVSIEIDDRPPPAWIAQQSAARDLAGRALRGFDLLSRSVPEPRRFVTVGVGGLPVAWGLGVVVGDAVGLFDVMVAAAARGRGHGRRLTTVLLASASEVGATWAFLQVGAANTAAQALYASLGFADAYGYHYRILD